MKLRICRSGSKMEASEISYKFYKRKFWLCTFSVFANMDFLFCRPVFFVLFYFFCFLCSESFSPFCFFETIFSTLCSFWWVNYLYLKVAIVQLPFPTHRPLTTIPFTLFGDYTILHPLLFVFFPPFVPPSLHFSTLKSKNFVSFFLFFVCVLFFDCSYSPLCSCFSFGC